MVYTIIAVFLSLRGEYSGAAEVSGLFKGAAPAVEVTAREATIRSPEGTPTPCYLSVADGVAITTAEIPEVNFQHFGELVVWDLSTGQVRHVIRTPARIMTIAGLRGSGRVVVAGGPRNKDPNHPFVWVVDLRSGEVTRQFEPAHAYAGRLLARIDGSGAIAVIQDRSKRDGNGNPVVEIAAYDLDGQTGPRLVPAREWDRLAASSSESAPAQGDTPPRISHVGDRDGGFVLAVDERDNTGIWRSDTWERVLRLGERITPWQSWSAAPDGMALVSWRAGHDDGFTVWDFRSLRVFPIQAPGFLPDLVPAFSANGRFLRFKRSRPEDGGSEIVSLDWNSGHETVAHRAPPDPYEHFNEADLTGVFSANGDSLVLVSAKTGETRRVRWNAEGASLVEGVRELGGRPLSLSDDGTVATVTAGSRDKGDTIEYLVSIVNLDSGTRLATWAAPTVGHTPTFAAAHDPESGRVALAHYTSGASLGYYSGNVALFDRGSIRDVDGFRSAPDEPSPARDEFAWTVQFLHLEGRRDPLLGIHTADGKFLTCSPDSGDVVHRFEWDGSGSALYDGDRRFPILRRIAATGRGRVFVPLRSGGIGAVDLQPDGSATRVADLWSLPDRGWFAVTPEGFYAVSPGSARHVIFRSGDTIHSFEQFDAFLNRPDKVAASFGAPPEEVGALQLAHERRLRTLGIEDPAEAVDSSTVPVLRIEGGRPLVLDRDSIRLEVSAEARGGRSIHRFLVSANGVPLDGREGRAPSAGESASVRDGIDVPLVPGENLIRVSARDSGGLESLAETIRVQRSASGSLPPELYVLAVGVSDYRLDQLDLTYPSKDAGDLAAALGDSATGFAALHRKVLVDGEATREGVLGERNFLRKSRPMDRVIVFVAGHGVLDERYRYYFATHEFDPGHMEGTGLRFEELESLFDGVPARERLLLMDTCQAGAVDAELLAELDRAGGVLPEGVRAVVPRGERERAATPSAPGSPHPGRFIEELYTDLRRGTGATVLSAAGGLEFALESDDWSNGIFTYSLIETVRDPGKADGDRDGSLQVSELLGRVAERVADLTNGLQHPNVRSANPAEDFPVVDLRDPSSPEDPLDFLKRYLAWSSSDSVHVPAPAGRILGLYGEEVAYFGKTLARASIAADLEQYNKTYDERTYTLLPGARVNAGDGGRSVTIDYDMAFRTGYFAETGETMRSPDGRLVKIRTRAFRDGKLKMRMGLARAGRDWKIVTIESR